MTPPFPPPAIQDLLDRLRPSMEPQKLAEFVEIRPGERVLEAGCGNGYISLFLAWKFPECREILAVDLNADLIEQARRTIDELQSLCPQPLPPVQFQALDARTLSGRDSLFEVLVCNPPFFARRSGRVSPDPARRQARMEETFSLQDLFELSERVLKPEGRLYLVFPAARRRELDEAAGEKGYAVTQSLHYPEIRKRSGGICLLCLERRGTNVHK